MFPFTLIRRGLPVALFCMLYILSYASEKVQVSPEPLWLYKVTANIAKKPTAKSISSGYYFELSDHQVNLVNNTDYTHYIKYIVNESGVQNESEVSVTFSPSFQQVVFHKLNLIRNSVIVSELRTSQIKVVQEETDASDFQYNGLKRAFVLLKDVRKDDRIEVAYSVIGVNPIFDGKYNDKLYFTGGTAIINYYETIIVPENRKLFMRFFNKAATPLEEVAGGLRIYHWSNPAYKLWQSQPGVPSWFNNYPCVSITEYDNWQEVVNWGLKIFEEYRFSLPDDLKTRILKWRKVAQGDPDIFASLAIQFVQDQVRYLGMEIGTYTHQPHSPAEVYQHRFGDCKDKALLLATILQQENIPAYVALVNTDLREKLKEEAPATSQFDHAIVAIARSKGYIFIDPTVSAQRGELVNMFVDAYGYALVIRKGEYMLQHVDPGFLNEVIIQESFDVRLADTSQLKVVSTFSGGKADDMRSSFLNMSTSEVEENFIQYYSKTFDGIELSEAIEYADDSVKNEIVVKEAYTIPNLWHTDDNGKETMDIIGKAVYEKIPDPSSILKDAPLALAFPSSLHYSIDLELPDTWSFPFGELHIKTASYEYNFVPTVKNRHIHLRYYFKTFKDHIPQTELNQFKADYKKILRTLEFQLSRNNQTTGVQAPADKKINWGMVCFAFMLVAGLAVLLKHLDKQHLGISYDAAPPLPIGGWLIVLGVSLVATALIQIFRFSTNEYFKESVWTTLGESGGFKLQLVLVAELTMAMVWLCGNLALLYWYFMRRNIFPRMFMGYAASLLLGNLMLILLYFVIPSPSTDNLLGSAGIQFGRTCFYALIWITYLIRSQRVKDTFVN